MSEDGGRATGSPDAHEFVFYVYDDDPDDPRFSFWLLAEDAGGMSLYERPPDGEGKWLCPTDTSDYGSLEPSEDFRRTLAELMDDGVDAGRVHDLDPHERHFVQAVHGTVSECPESLPEPVYGFLHDCAEEFDVEPDVVTDGGRPRGEDPVPLEFGGECPPGEIPEEPVPILEFAPEYRHAICAGDKTATVRYRSRVGANLMRGDVVDLETESGTPLKRVTVDAVAACDVFEAPEVLDALAARYPHDTPHELVAALNRHYDATIEAGDTAQCVVWRLEGGADAA